MKIPYTISKDTKEAYENSPSARGLVGEDARKLIAENFEWDAEHCPSLVDICIKAISHRFRDFPFLEELPCPDRNRLIEILDLSLDLEQLISLIEDDYYWKRLLEFQFNILHLPREEGYTWKRRYLERYVQKIIEEAEPEYEDEYQMEEILTLCCPYVKNLILSQLRCWMPPRTWAKEDLPDVFPNDHIHFEPIVSKLEFIETLEIVFGIKDVFKTFTWNMFKITVDDAKRLGEAVLSLQHLKTFRIHRTKLDYEHVQALAHGLVKDTTIKYLDLAHCHIDDKAALCIAKILMTHPCLEKLSLYNNNIENIGAEGIGFALLSEECCPLIHLNLRLNPLRHTGTMGILRALIRNSKQTEVNLAGCNFEPETAIRVTQMLQLNVHLKKLDVSCNWFDEEGGEFLIEALKINRTLEHLDIRDTDITPKQEARIKKYLRRNQLELDDVSEEEELDVVDLEDAIEKYVVSGVGEDEEDEEEYEIKDRSSPTNAAAKQQS